MTYRCSAAAFCTPAVLGTAAAATIMTTRRSTDGDSASGVSNAAPMYDEPGPLVLTPDEMRDHVRRRLGDPAFRAQLSEADDQAEKFLRDNGYKS